MANLKGLVPRELTEAETSHIHELQAEIDEIWTKKGDYKCDPDAWKQMPLFMKNISEKDVLENEACAALSEMVYNEVPPEELAENMKKKGNTCLNRILSGQQEVNQDNMLRAAISAYTEGIDAKCDNLTLNSQLFCNRSMANLLMQNFGHGLADAQRAILMNPDYSKAYFRGARCAEKTRKWEIALSLIDKGKQCNPAPSADAIKEFDQLRETVLAGKASADVKERSDKLKQRSKAAKSMNIVRQLTTAGIKISQKGNIRSDHMGMVGDAKPYIDQENIIHVPLLILYDEFDTSEFMRDVACDACMAEVLDVLMPFPFDQGRGRYEKFDDIVAFFEIDDGVNMPTYHEIDLGWPLLEVFRSENYLMPGLLPIVHIVSRHSDEMLTRFKLRGN